MLKYTGEGKMEPNGKSFKDKLDNTEEKNTEKS